jgi:hypothetical protein
MTSREGFKGFITFSGLVVLVGLTTTTVLYTNQAKNITSQASVKDVEPREIQIKANSSNVLTISWITPAKTLGTLFYTTEQNSKCLTEQATTTECDFVIENNEKNNHEIELKNLISGKKYFYKIKINGEMYPANGILMSFTAPSIEQKPNQPKALDISILNQQTPENAFELDSGFKEADVISENADSEGFQN